MRGQIAGQGVGEQLAARSERIIPALSTYLLARDADPRWKLEAACCDESATRRREPLTAEASIAKP
jgi:hypothetical protein